MKHVKCGRCVKCGKEYKAVPNLTNCECGGILDIIYDYDYIKTTLTKEKLAKSVNKIIDAEVEYNVLRYKLRRTKPQGEAKRDMKRRKRESRASIRYYLSDYRRFLKRARAYAERERGVKIQIIWILSVLVVIVVLTVLYLRFEAPVNAFFKKIFSFFH